MIARLKGGPLDAGVVNVQDTTKWLFLQLAEPGVDLTTIKMSMPLMRTAEWPGDEGPIGRPPGFVGPMVCYRLLQVNALRTKAEFEYDEDWSDDVAVEFHNVHPPR